MTLRINVGLSIGTSQSQSHPCRFGMKAFHMPPNSAVLVCDVTCVVVAVFIVGLVAGAVLLLVIIICAATIVAKRRRYHYKYYFYYTVSENFTIFGKKFQTMKYMSLCCTKVTLWLR